MSTPSFAINAADIVTQAQTIFSALAGVAVVAIGFKLGPKLLMRVARMF